ncbi:MAG: hypothetical protein KatS3mg085_048 [Candidatus Dojkabacteria bacterium]|nr:MAG: hypothetical protein KatS3mg085_048 [Candidatus Dojkabacteria bacterium]
MREGSAIYDTLHADRVVIGGGDENAKIKIIEVFKNVDEFKNTVDTQNFQEYAKTYITDDNGKGNFVSKLVLTSIESAELIKVTANAFLALKISFANSIALLCDETGANINEVMDGLGLDRRISRSFLYAGLGWGGGCFPKDVSGLMSTFKAFGLSNPILDGAVQVNDFMPEFVTQKVLKINKSKVAILGLSFKPGTSDVRKSQSIKLANTLAKHKLYVFAFDPQANEEARRDLDTSIKICKSIEEAVEQAEIIVIATEWNEFKNINWKKLSKQTKARVVIDARNALNRKELKSAGFNYQGVGIGEV